MHINALKAHLMEKMSKRTLNNSNSLGGRFRARASGRGMWDVEGGGGWGSVVDYLPG